MWKILLIILLIFFLLPKIAKFFFRGLFSTMEKQAKKAAFQQSNGQKIKREGDIEIQYDEQKSGKDDKHFRGGEYVDYEEIE